MTQQQKGAPSGALSGPLESIPLPPGMTEIQFVDALLEMARQFLASEDTRDVERALGLIAAARKRLATVGGKEGTAG